MKVFSMYTKEKMNNCIIKFVGKKRPMYCIVHWPFGSKNCFWFWEETFPTQNSNYLEERIFCGRKFCGIYFCDFDPYSQKSLPQNLNNISQSQTFLPHNFSKLVNRKNFFRKKSTIF